MGRIEEREGPTGVSSHERAKGMSGSRIERVW